MNKLSDKMLLSETKTEEQEVMNEFAKNEDKYLRRSIAFTRLLKNLYDLDTLTPMMVHGWIKLLLENGSDKSLEFLCMLMKALGETFEADTKVWMIASKDKPESSELSELQVYMEELSRLINQRKTSMKVRFMMMVVVKLHKNSWRKKDNDNYQSMDEVEDCCNEIITGSQCSILPNNAETRKVETEETQSYFNLCPPNSPSNPGILKESMKRQKIKEQVTAKKRKERKLINQQ